VAWLVWLLTPGWATAARFRLVMAALAHDIAEHEVGDMPAPAKREMGIRDLFGRHEATLLNEVQLHFEDNMDPEEKRVLKLADALDGAYFCLSEAALGNRRIGQVFMNFRSYVEEFAPFNDTEDELITYLDNAWGRFNGK
jgi:5'-deoxynucleotidase YfbR-like HD superfamily hydrolase